MGTADKIFVGLRLLFRPVTVGDAAYIQDLRSRHGEHLSAPVPSVEAQRAWIERYLPRVAQGREYYFVIERLDDNAPCGVVRLYDIIDGHFTWGSWILDANKPPKAALDSALLIYRVAFELLDCKFAIFDVRIGNEKTLAFHRRFGAVEIGSDAENIYFRIDAINHMSRAVELTEQIWKVKLQPVEKAPVSAKPLRRKNSILARHYVGEPGGFFPRLRFHYHRKSRQWADRAILRQQEKSMRRQHHALRRQESVLRHEEKTLNKKNKKLEVIHEFILKRYRLFLWGDTRPSTQVLPMTSYQNIAKTSYFLAPPIAFQVTPPHPPSTLMASVTGEMPALAARVLKKVDACSCASALLKANQISVPEYYCKNEAAIIDDGELLLSSLNNRGTVKTPEPSQVHKTGVMLFGSGAYNWYHWLIETLPAAYLAQSLPEEFADYPLVIPEQIANASTFRQSLELFKGNRGVISLGKGMHRFESLIQIDAPVREPMNMRDGVWPKAEDYAFNGQVLREYRDQILQKLQIEIPAHKDRIFLARGNGRRSYNQGELVDIAVRQGFRAVYPENLTLREQVMLYSGASHVIGPSGAAFANTLFCQPKTRLLSWVIPQYSGFCSYANIAQLTGSDLRYLFAIPDQPINSTSAGFGASYQVAIPAFQAALEAMEQPGF